VRAFVIEALGEMGSVRDVPAPEPEPGEVLVAVRSASVNPADVGVVKGFYKEFVEHRLPLIPGIDVSGEITAVGEGVEGDVEAGEVYGVSTKPFYGAGTFAEFATLPSGSISPKPTTVDHTGAAALPHAALTALSQLDAVEPQAGQVVLIVGATGGVGSYAMQLAAHRGARVVAVARGENTDYARDLGASEVIDYTTGDLLELVRARYPEGVDAIIDNFNDRDGLTRLSELVREGGRVTSPKMAVDAEELGRRGIKGSNVARADPSRLNELTGLVEKGELHVPETRTYALDAAAAALEEVERGHVRGKLVLTIG
jgi:NADPH2:quinone reductase